MKVIIISISILLSANTVYAQYADFSLKGLVMVPQGQFKENVNDVGFGLSGAFNYYFLGTPFSLGLDMGYSLYGSRSTEDYIDWIGDVDITTSNNIFFTHLTGKVQQDFGFVRPYVEAFFGTKNLWTDTEVTALDVVEDEDDVIDDETHIYDWSTVYGLGGGLAIKLTEYDFGISEDDIPMIAALYLDLKVKYMFGGESDYLKEGDISPSLNIKKVKFNKSHSEIEFMTYHIGIVFYIL